MRTLIWALSGRKCYTLFVEEQLVDIRAVCPQDVKKFLSKPGLFIGRSGRLSMSARS